MITRQRLTYKYVDINKDLHKTALIPAKTLRCVSIKQKDSAYIHKSSHRNTYTSKVSDRSEHIRIRDNTEMCGSLYGHI